jgi:hypothetical protein
MNSATALMTSHNIMNPDSTPRVQRSALKPEHRTLVGDEQIQRLFVLEHNGEMIVSEAHAQLIRLHVRM